MHAEGEIPAGLTLIETLGWTRDDGFRRLERHLARMAGSAATLGFPFDVVKAREALESASSRANMPSLRLRIQLDRSGALQVDAAIFVPLPTDKIWAATIAAPRLDAEDPLLRHKTSRRETYERGRAEALRRGADEAIFLNQSGALCDGGITNLFIPAGNGLLLTPPLDAGCLAGVLRQELLDSGKASEADLFPQELMRADHFLLGNSLRGLIPARMLAHS